MDERDQPTDSSDADPTLAMATPAWSVNPSSRSTELWDASGLRPMSETSADDPREGGSDWIAADSQLAKPLSTTVSVGADMLRVVATLMVVTWHVVDGRLYALHDIRTATGLALGSFFLLSGFVVRHSTVRKSSTFRRFWESRSARLLSALVPALLVTLLIDAVLARANPAFFQEQIASDYGHPWIRFFAQIIFASQIWFQDIAAFSNSPLWTLGYEGPAYLLYSCAFFFRGRIRALAVAATALFYGPQVLVLFGCWAGGAALHDTCQRRPASIGAGAVSLLLGASILVGAVWIDLPSMVGAQLQSMGILDQWCSALRRADEFPTFFVSALGFAFIIYGLNGVAPRTNRLAKRISPFFLWLGSFCFSIYVFHYPILLLVKGLGGFEYEGATGPIVSLAAAVFGSYALSFVSEARRGQWQSAISFVIESLSRVFRVLSRRASPTAAPTSLVASPVAAIPADASTHPRWRRNRHSTGKYPKAPRPSRRSA